MKIFRVIKCITIYNLLYLKFERCLLFKDQVNENFQRTLSIIFSEKNIKYIKKITVNMHLLGIPSLYEDEIVECIIKKNDKNIPVYAIFIEKLHLTNKFHWTDHQCNRIYKLKLDLNGLSKITKIYHKTILNVLDFFEIDEFYCIIQERNKTVKSISDMLKNDAYTNWIIKKIMLHRIYAFNYVYSVDILKRYDGNLLEPIDENYNLKNGAFFSFVEKNDSMSIESPKYILSQNFFVFSFNCLNYQKDEFSSLIKKGNLNCQRNIMLKFCEMMSTNIYDSDVLKKSDEFIKFMGKLSTDDKMLLSKCINHPFFSENIISISDFRKFKFKKLRISSCEVEIIHNMIIFKMFENMDIIEITINETANRILLFSGQIHYHSLDIRINKEPIDPDQEDEKGFKELKTKIENLFTEIELYTKDKVLLELTNDYLSILKYKNKSSYVFIFKRHYIKDSSTLFVAFNRKKLKFNNFHENVTNEERDTYKNQITILLEKLIKIESQIFSLNDSIVTTRELDSLRIKSALDHPHVELPYIYIPGVGIKKLEQKGMDNVSVASYIIDDYEISTFSKSLYFVKNVFNNSDCRVLDITTMGSYVPKMQLLIEASFFEVIK